MFETLFGAEMPLAMRFFIAFVIVLALIGAFFWVMRRFGAERLGSAGNRGRQPRLAVIDAAPVDGRRRLVLIRRDNVEHLLMIGGPSDVVVEANIVRAAAAQRDMPVPRTPAAADTLPRPVPLADGTLWPLQPEPVPTPARPPRAVEEAQWTAEPEPAPPPPVEVPARRPDPMARLQRGQDSTLAGLGGEPMVRHAPDIGSIRPAPMIERAPERPAERIPAAERSPDRASAVERAPPGQRMPAAERTIGRAPVPERPPVAERPPTAERPPVAERAPAAERPPTIERTPAPVSATLAAPPAEPPPAGPVPAEPLSPIADENLTEMAQRLEAALRRPMVAEPRPDSRTRPASEPAPAASAEVAPAAPEPRAKPKSLYDSLEQEMASLLGRPAGKP